MEDFKKKTAAEANSDKEIVFSKSIKAGKRIYYLDVKKNRKEEMFLAITESKKIVSGEGEDSSFSFEKHKIFLYREDFDKFKNGLEQAIEFINKAQGNMPKAENSDELEKEDFSPKESLAATSEIKIDIDF